MIKITSISRLMAVASRADLTSAPMENQMTRVKQRLDSGTDITGRSFKGYADGRSWRPLSGASRFLQDVRYNVTRTLTGFELRATILGKAAAVLGYQNAKRNFLGFSSNDREAVGQDLLNEIRRDL